MPCHHHFDEALAAYLESAGLADDPKGPLFRTIARGTRTLTRTALPQANAYDMIRRRAAAAGIKTKIGNHSFARLVSPRFSPTEAAWRRPPPWQTTPPPAPPSCMIGAATKRASTMSS
jgi:hypothetical protein